MDKLSSKLLSILKTQTQEGKYAIVEHETLITMLDEDVTAIKVKDMIDEISSQGYIRIKYSDLGETCFTLTEKSRHFVHNHYKNDKPVSYKKVGFWGFLGAVLGSAFFYYVIKPIIEQLSR